MYLVLTILVLQHQVSVIQVVQLIIAMKMVRLKILVSLVLHPLSLILPMQL